VSGIGMVVLGIIGRWKDRNPIKIDVGHE